MNASELFYQCGCGWQGFQYELCHGHNGCLFCPVCKRQSRKEVTSPAGRNPIKIKCPACHGYGRGFWMGRGLINKHLLCDTCSGEGSLYPEHPRP